MRTLGESFRGRRFGWQSGKGVGLVIVIGAGIEVLLPFAGVDEVERAIGADAVQPGGEGRASVELSDLFPGFEKRFPHHILCVDFIGGHTISEPEDSLSVALDEHPKSIAIAAPRLVYGDIVACIHPVVRLDC